MFTAGPPGVPPGDLPVKRKKPQAKVACTNCRRQHAGCTDGRPCERCVRMGLAATCEDTPKKKRSRKKHLAEFDEDDHYELGSDAMSTRSKSPSGSLMSPPPAKRSRRSTGANTRRRMAQLISEIDPNQSALLPPGTLPSMSNNGLGVHGQGAGGPYSMSPFDTSYLDSLGLGRQFSYGPPPTAYGAPASYQSGPSEHGHPGASAFPLSQTYPFYPSQYNSYGHPAQSAGGAPSSLHGLPPSALSASTTASTSSSAQQQTSSSYSTNLRTPMLPSHATPRYVGNPMASLPSFPYSQMYNQGSNWMGYQGPGTTQGHVNFGMHNSMSPTGSHMSSPHSSGLSNPNSGANAGPNTSGLNSSGLLVNPSNMLSHSLPLSSPSLSQPSAPLLPSMSQSASGVGSPPSGSLVGLKEE